MVFPAYAMLPPLDDLKGEVLRLPYLHDLPHPRIINKIEDQSRLIVLVAPADP